MSPVRIRLPPPADSGRNNAPFLFPDTRRPFGFRSFCIVAQLSCNIEELGMENEVRMTDKTLPLREGECPGGARGYDSVTRHTPPASGHPLYLRGGVCTNRLKLDGDIPEDCKRRSRHAPRRDRQRRPRNRQAWLSPGRRRRRRRSASAPSRRRLRRPIRMC